MCRRRWRLRVSPRTTRRAAKFRLNSECLRPPSSSSPSAATSSRFSANTSNPWVAGRRFCTIQRPALTSRRQIRGPMEPRFRSRFGRNELDRSLTRQGAGQLTKYLKCQLEPQLNLSRVVGGSNLSEAGGVLNRGRIVEIRVIREVEGLGAKLKTHILPNRESACEREIDIHQTRPRNRVPSCVSERVRGRKIETRRVEPARHGFGSVVRIAAGHSIGTIQILKRTADVAALGN